MSEATANIREEAHHVELRRVMRRFVEAEMPREAARRWDQENHFPRDVFKKLARLGVVGAAIPEEYGGSGRDIYATMLIIEELARRSMAVAVPYIMAACYAGMNIYASGSAAQRDKLLPEIAAGRILFAYGLTEPDVGADLASVKTTAVRDGGRVIVNGVKRFISGTEISDYIYTLVRSDGRGARYQNLSLLLISPRLPGVSISRIDCLGMKGAATTDVVFDDVVVSEDDIIGGPEGWNRAWPMLAGPCLDVEKLEVGALALGIAEAALDDAWGYSQQRSQFGKLICHYQAVRHALAEGRTRLYAARQVLNDATGLAQLEQPCGLETSMAKLFVCETAKNVVLDCQSILGAYGYAKDFDMERYVRDVLLMPIIGGSSVIQKNNISNRLGLPKG